MKRKGINYDVGIQFNEQFNSRPTFDLKLIKRELQIIRDDLHCNAIRLSGTDLDRLVQAARIALGLGLEVWFAPQLHNKNAEQTRAYILEGARAAETLRQQWPDRVIFVLGCELTLFMHGIMKGETFEKRIGNFFNLAQLLMTHRFSKKLNAFLAPTVPAVRQEFHGAVTYAAVPFEKVDWTPFDYIGLDYYRDSHNRRKYGKELSKFAMYRKPIVITEVGLCGYKGAENKGAMGHAITVKTAEGRHVKPGFVRDEALQARELTDMLQILEKNGVEGTFVFIFAWSAFLHSENPIDDLDMASYSIVKTLASGHGTTYPDMPWEPKQAFNAVADFYKQR